jgi:transposase
MCYNVISKIPITFSLEVVNFTMKKIEIDFNHVKELYLSGKTIEQIAPIIGISKATLEVRARQEGLKFRDLRPTIITKPRADMIDLPIDEIVRLYNSGMPKRTIAKRFNVAEMVIHDRLKRVGILPAASRSEATKIAMSRMTKEQRQAITKAAHDAVRGSKRSFADLEKRAKGVEMSGKIASQYEADFADFLTKNKINFIPQKAVGVYNCDFAVNPVMVELFGGGFHAYGRHKARLADRIRYILNEGWNIYVIWVMSGEKIINPIVFDDFIAFLQKSSRNPSFRGQYRVIWSNGDFISSGNLNNGDFSDIIPNTMRHHTPRKNTCFS